MSRKGSFSCSFEAIPEISPKGALVKIAYAGAHLRNGQRSGSIPTTQNSWKDYLNEEKMTDNNQNFIASPRIMTMHKQRKMRRSNNNHGSGSNLVSQIDEKLTHNYELSGYIEILGEDVEDNSNFAVGDRVLVYPFPEQSREYSEYVCVPDLRYLIKLPNEISLVRAVGLASAALYAFNLAADLKDHCINFAGTSDGSTPKILVVGSKPLILWTLSLFSYLNNETEEHPRIVIATIDDSILNLKKQYQSFHFIQWTKDAYDPVLKEMTVQALGGSPADVLVNLEASPKMFQRGFMCLKKEGKIFLLSEFLTKHTKCLLLNYAGDSDIDVTISRSGSQKNFLDVLDLAQSNEIHLPHVKELSLTESTKVSDLTRNGLLSSNVVLRLQQSC